MFVWTSRAAPLSLQLSRHCFPMNNRMAERLILLRARRCFSKPSCSSVSYSNSPIMHPAHPIHPIC